MLIASLMLATVAAAAEAPAAASEAVEEPDFSLALAPHGAVFSNDFGTWYGGQARLWLLDVTGERRWSGFLEVTNLHWRPEDPSGSIESGDVDTVFTMARVLRHVGRWFYGFATLGGTVGQPLFPRFQAEAEANLLVPPHPAIVLTFGGGYRLMREEHRPYLVAGGSYSLPKMGFAYRVYTSAGMTRDRAATHLLTWLFGERRRSWWRLDLLFGDETLTAATATPVSGNVSSKALSLTVEQWVAADVGITGTLSWSENTSPVVPGPFYRALGMLGAFVTF